MQVSWLVKNNMFLGHQMTFVEFAWAHLCTLVTLSILLQYENKMIAIKLKIFIGFPILSHVRSSSLLQFIYEMGNSLITPLVRNRNGTTKIYLFQNHVFEHLTSLCQPFDIQNIQDYQKQIKMYTPSTNHDWESIQL